MFQFTFSSGSQRWYSMAMVNGPYLKPPVIPDPLESRSSRLPHFDAFTSNCTWNISTYFNHASRLPSQHVVRRSEFVDVLSPSTSPSREEYVALTTAAYRQAIDRAWPDDAGGAANAFGLAGAQLLGDARTARTALAQLFARGCELRMDGGMKTWSAWSRMKLGMECLECWGWRRVQKDHRRFEGCPGDQIIRGGEEY